MYQLFKKIKAKCETCGTPLDGTNIDRIGDKFYCRADFEKISPQEKYWNKKIEKDNETFKNIIAGAS